METFCQTAALFNLPLCSKRDSKQRRGKLLTARINLSIPHFCSETSRRLSVCLCADVNQTETCHLISECMLQMPNSCIKLTKDLLWQIPFTATFAHFWMVTFPPQTFSHCPCANEWWVELLNFNKCHLPCEFLNILRGFEICVFMFSIICLFLFLF